VGGRKPPETRKRIITMIPPSMMQTVVCSKRAGTAPSCVFGFRFFPTHWPSVRVPCGSPCTPTDDDGAREHGCAARALVAYFPYAFCFVLLSSSSIEYDVSVFACIVSENRFGFMFHDTQQRLIEKPAERHDAFFFVGSYRK